jgi:hypothetical protein
MVKYWCNNLLINLFNMKKLLIGLSFIFVFILGIILTSNQSDAALAVTVTADATSVASGGSTMIHWNAPAAYSCTRRDTGTVFVGTSGDFNSGGLTATKTFWVDCTDEIKACYTGIYSSPDPVHPNGGSVTYVNGSGTTVTQNNIWSGAVTTIYYKKGTTRTTAGATSITCP